MPRARNIKPGFFKNEELARLAGQIARQAITDEGEREHAEEALIGHIQAEMRRR